MINENVYSCCWLKDNSTMYKTEAQIVSYGILYLNPSSHKCQPSYKKYIGLDDNFKKSSKAL